MIYTNENIEVAKGSIILMYDFQDVQTLEPIFKTRILSHLIISISNKKLTVQDTDLKKIMRETEQLKKYNIWDYEEENRILANYKKQKQINESLKLMSPEERAIYHKKKSESTDKLIEEVIKEFNIQM